MTVQDDIKNIVQQHDVVLFMKGIKTQPQCGFSTALVNILDSLQVEYKDVNVLSDMALREGIKQYTDWPTIPQLYVKGEFIGGCDIVIDMHKSGELTEVFTAKQIDHQPLISNGP